MSLRCSHGVADGAASPCGPGTRGRDGGCLLADDVGTGKTYVALAVSRTWRRPLVVVPASLRPTWRDALSRADISCDVTSHEALSRGRVPDGTFDGIIVDESHRFRSTTA